MASQLAILSRTRSFLKTLNPNNSFKTISTFAFLSQEAQLAEPSPAPATPLPPNPASGSPLYNENWRNPIPASVSSQSMIPLSFINQTPAYQIQSMSRTHDVQSLMNVFANWMALQRWADVKELFESWVRSLDKNGKPNKPDVNLYNHYLRANLMMGASAGDLLDLVAQMEDFAIKANTASFNLVIKAMYQARETEAATKLLERLADKPSPF